MCKYNIVSGTMTCVKLYNIIFETMNFPSKYSKQNVRGFRSIETKGKTPPRGISDGTYYMYDTIWNKRAHFIWFHLDIQMHSRTRLFLFSESCKVPYWIEISESNATLFYIRIIRLVCHINTTHRTPLYNVHSNVVLFD